ncbi:hypothetical protein CCH79_00019740 [Gambusia affinis]|uniref:Uncharacterized protein n=1 Tax=Gambusia affinis TaxID=33528 RepID=A0A315VAU6_GAMAF|nr:hypothetical protein CCH79_00019740 [Gambusia affinis]
MKPLYLNSGAYSFTAFAGVPAMELRFTEDRPYPFLNTPLDTVPRLQEVLGGRLGVTGRSLAELVGEMVLRLVHDHILPLRITSYAQTVLQFSAHLNKHSAELQVDTGGGKVEVRWRSGGVLQVSISWSLSSQSRGVSPQWLFSARGDYSRAAETLQRAIDYSDLHDPNTARLYNTRIMKVDLSRLVREKVDLGLKKFGSPDLEPEGMSCCHGNRTKSRGSVLESVVRGEQRLGPGLVHLQLPEPTQNL